MEFALRLDQPNVERPAASRRLLFGPRGAPAFSLLNGVGATFEGGTDEPELSLKWLAKGRAEYRSEGRSYRLDGATQLLLNRGQPYRMRMQGPSESLVLFFPRAAADAAWAAQGNAGASMPEFPTVAAVPPQGLRSRVCELHGEARRQAPDGARLLELSCAVLNDVAALSRTRRDRAARLPVVRKTTRDELLRRLVRAEAYLTDVGAQATLAGAANAAALSPFHLIRLFDAAFGETPLAYATSRRLDEARALLIETELSIPDIAERAGYDDRNAFDRAFARRFGRSPGAIRAAR